MADSRISIGIPNMFNGVSQQAENLRLPSQATEQKNLYSSLVRGLTKRPPSTNVAKLMTGTGGEENSYVHFVDRGDGEEYVAIFGDTTVNVYDINTGVEYPVYSPNGLSYLNVANTPLESIRATSLADYTMVINKEVVTAMDTTEVQEEIPVGVAYAWVKRGNYGCSYVISIAGTEYTYTTADPVSTSPTFFATDDIADELVTTIGTLTGYTISSIGSLVKVVKDDGTDFSFGVADSFASEALVGLKVNVGKQEDLPDVGEEGMHFRVTGTGSDKDDDYYVRYDSNSGSYKGVWEEYRGWDQYNIFDASTMPHRLVRSVVTGTEDGALATWITGEGLLTGDTYFLFDQTEWTERLVGDETTAPTPEFIGQTITDIFFHNSRLGMLSGEWIFLSRISDFFQFWPTTVRISLDDGTIRVSTGQISELHSAVSWQSSLLTFSDRNQIQITSNGALSPDTVKSDETTTFESEPLAHPIPSGPNVYFSADRSPYTVIREYFISNDGVSNDATNITGHVPEYIPEGVFDMASNSNEDTLLVLSTGQRDTIYNYKYYWAEGNKLQSSWSTFVFEDATIMGIDFFGTDVYMVCLRDGDVYLETFPLQIYSTDTGLNYLVRLDRKCEVTGVYDSGTNVTTFTLPYTESTDNPLTVVLGPDFTGRGGLPIEGGLRPTTSTLTLSGDFSAGEVYIGKPFEAKYTFSPFYVRTGDQENSALLTGRMIIQEMLVTYGESGDWRFEVEIPGRDTSTQRQAGILGDSAYKVGEIFLKSGVARCSVQASNLDATISMINDDPFPSRWLNAEVIATYDATTRRI